MANLTVGTGGRAVGIRADMDALNITENAGCRAHASSIPGKMHACGHDGHMAMVLGAARLLSERRDFNGTIRFVFQPAEEHGRGAKAMMADGLFDRFPVDALFGAHNMPGMPAGAIATRVGGIMASEDNFVIRIRGRGTHAARPHMGADPLVIGAEIVLALQTVVSRNVDPSQPAVVSCTEFITDGIRNAIPSHVVIKGDTRSYNPDVQTLLENRMRAICEGICRAHQAECEFEYTHEFAPTVNWPACVPVAVAAARRVVGASRVSADIAPMMISEDFGAFLTQVPGAFAFIGNGATGETGSVRCTTAPTISTTRCWARGRRISTRSPRRHWTATSTSRANSRNERQGTWPSKGQDGNSAARHAPFFLLRSPVSAHRADPVTLRMRAEERRRTASPFFSCPGRPRQRRRSQAAPGQSIATFSVTLAWRMATWVLKLFTFPETRNSSRVSASYSVMLRTFSTSMKSKSPVT